MEKLGIDDVDPFVFEGGERRGFSDPLGTTDVAVNHYRIAPGEGFPAGLHAHVDQEEVFVVLAGVATFETMDGEVRVEAGEAIRFAPGEFQSGRNDADGDGGADGDADRNSNGESDKESEDGGNGREEGDDGGNGREEGDDELVVLALGAPRETDDIRIPATCPGCGHENVRLDLTGGELTFVCPACDREFVPKACPECGHEELRVTLADSSGNRTVTICRGCGAEFDEPPIRE